jgi:acetoin utilization deacetylase AcuC-like enzyme
VTFIHLAGPEAGQAHTRPGHPERPARVDAAVAGILDLHLGDEVAQVEPRWATVEELARVHSPAYLGRLEHFCAQGGGQLDADTYAGPGSWDAARRAAGAALAAVDAVRQSGEGAGFVAARPPGHHARADQAMGFCLLNNVAVAAACLADAGERVAIVDWDVHHGNGTQDLFWNDPRILYVSTHQAPFYPGTGWAEEVGGPDAFGLTVNIPLPAGATGDVVERALAEVVAPVVDGFSPTWVLVSAGFDAHRDDPLADLRLSSGDFARLARQVADFVPGPGRLVLVLEGGYDLDAIRHSVTAAVGALVGTAVDLEPPTSGGPGVEAVIRAFRSRAAALGLGAVGRRGLA